ncbi:ABC transporter permease [Streptomyces sp. SID8366]|uniref:FtsX-like permease family protein n=1 Tax=unclassified Streptomyces TaxID=2593676 RepID=UPI000DBAD21E|nr:FtsX-like permease family protein [Streptomyces sp. PsTaAH-130]MYU08976.1 ABC transporter permease [Streptomyces sp. SID8366]MYU66844.1 ABC transporter permease [Streptomyces sp. SID69]
MWTEARLAWRLGRGADRREWWRAGLTAAGAALATGFAQAAVALAALRGQYRVSVGGGLLDQQGERSGVVLALLLLLVPVLGFLGQCARIGAVHRDRRLAGLRLAGATPAQVRRIAALETGPACLLGSLLATVAAVTAVLRLWSSPEPAAWAGLALIALGVPVVGTAVAVLALRRVVASPLGRVRRVRPRGGRGPLLVGGLLFFVLLGALDAFGGTRGWLPLTVFALVLLAGAGTVGLAGAMARLAGRLVARRARTAAALIAAERLRDDPWAAARTHAAVLLVTVVGTGFAGVRQALLVDLRRMRQDHGLGMPMSFYTTGIDLTGAAILVALAITLCGLAVATAESLASRRRGLAAQVAAGVPRAVLGRALLLETALPLLPALVLAGAGGMAIGTWYATVTGGTVTVPYAALLVPVLCYACCLASAATALPLLHRSARPGELRYA